MLLTLIIRNDRITLGAYQGSTLAARADIGADKQKTADEYAVLFKSIFDIHKISTTDFDGAICASVVPSLTETLKDAVNLLLGVRMHVIGSGIKTGLTIKTENPAELGADLVANAAGAVAAFGAPVIVADFGTATTVIAVDEKSALQGGAIMPGIGMSLQALNSAELLPGVPVDGTVLSLGKNTPDCMRAGVIRGTAMAVCGFAADYKKMLKLPQDTPLVVCGGLVGAARAYLPADAKYVPNLTLCGLAAIYRLNQKN